MSIFDEVIDRSNTGAIKVDFYRENDKPNGLIPLWVADMDFRSPPEVQNAMRQLANHGVFGYTHSKSSYIGAFLNWMKQNFEWTIDPEWIVQTPGVMFTIGLAIRALVDPAKNESVLIQEPVYYPFRRIVLENHRRLVLNDIVNVNGHYEINFGDFEQKIVDNKVKMFLLCSPHNPVGRVWRKEELLKMASICIKYNVLVVSDEIHSDLVYPGRRHHVFATLGKECAGDCLICTSPGKTFNMPGLQIANTIIPNRYLRERINAEKRMLCYYEASAPALAAAEAAYRTGFDWRNELLDYLAGNLNILQNALQETKIKVIQPEGTYLVWLDCRALGLNSTELDRFFVNAGLWLSPGVTFGRGGVGYMRINIASPRSVIQEAVTKLKDALAKLPVNNR